MSSKDPDSDIARLFEEQRRADEASAPSYRQVRARRIPERRPGVAVAGRIGRPAFAAAALLVLVAAAVLILRPSRPSRPSPLPPASAASLASWRSPTEIFLQTPGVELLSRAPALVSPILASPSLDVHVPLTPASPSERG